MLSVTLQMVYSPTPLCHPAVSVHHIICQNCLRIFMYQKNLKTEVFSFCPACGVKDCEGFQCPPSGAGTSQAPAPLVQELWLLLLNSVSHSARERKCAQNCLFSLLAENCCCRWLSKIQFSCNGWMLERKNRRRTNTGNTENGRWNFILLALNDISDFFITENTLCAVILAEPEVDVKFDFFLLFQDMTTLQLCNNDSSGKCEQVPILPFCMHLELSMVYCHALPGQGKENGTDHSGEPQNQIIYYVLLKSSYHSAYVPLKFPYRNCFSPLFCASMAILN